MAGSVHSLSTNTVYLPGATISIKDESEIRPEIAKAIIQKGFNLYELSLQRNSLEDVFHSLTTDSNEENTAKGGN